MLHYDVGPRRTRDEKRQGSFCTGSSIVVTKGAAFPAMLSSIDGSLEYCTRAILFSISTR